MNNIGWLAAIAAVSGIVLGWSARWRQEGGLRSDVDYIKRGIDDIRLEQRAQGQKIDALAERVTRVEEASKQAHHRLNRLDGQRERED